MTPQNKVFQNDDLRRLIIKYIISKKCEICHNRILHGNTCISCIWKINNPNINMFS